MALTEIDRSLLSRCLTGNSAAWRDFVDRFIGVFIHVIRHTAESRSVPLTNDLLEDLCAEVFAQLVDEDFAILRRFRGKSSLATYLTVVARRIVVKEITRRRLAEAMGHVNARGVTEAASDRPERRIESQEEVERLLGLLPPNEAEVVKRYHLQGMSYREISHELRIPENSIGAILSRARQKLRERYTAS